MSEVVLQVHQVSRSFGQRRVLRNVTFSVTAGTLVGIFGENGAGKTTLLRILAGELQPSSGQIFRSGTMGYCPQEAIVNGKLTVDQHLDYFCAAYTMTNLHYAKKLLKKLDYDQYQSERVEKLSEGTKQKLHLTLALMHQPNLLLLDEPHQGFDWETYLRFWELAHELREQRCAILIISHLLFEEDRFDLRYRLQEGCLQLQQRADHSDTERGVPTG